MSTIQLLQRKALLDDLVYLLAGLDTTDTFIAGSPPAISSSYDLKCFAPFEFVIFKIREFYKIEMFDCYVQRYLKKLAALRETVGSIEELFVALQDEMQLFKDLDRVNTIVREPGDFPFSTNIKSFSGVDKQVLRDFQSKESAQIAGLIERWINQADPTTLVEVRVPEDFVSSQWRDMFKIKQIGLSKTELEGIETAGKVVFYARMIFGIEVVDDSLEEQEYIVKRRLPPNSPIKKAETESDILADVGFEDDRSAFVGGKDPFVGSRDPFVASKDPFVGENGSFRHGTNGLDLTNTSDRRNENGCMAETLCSQVRNVHIESQRVVSPLKYQGKISERRTELLSILNSLVSKQLSIELRLIEDVALLQNGTLLTSILERFQDQLFGSAPMIHNLNTHYRESTFSKTEDSPHKIQPRTRTGHCTFENTHFIAFEQCDSTLGEYVMKLQKFQRIAQRDQFLMNIQQIGISFKDGLLQHFVPKKTYFEIKILFRFLFSVASSIFYLQRVQSYNFTRVLSLIFMKIRSDSLAFLPEFFRKGDWELPHGGSFSLHSFSDDFESIISGYMKKFYVTNPDVFPIWTKLLDVSLGYLQIEYKEHIVESEYNSHVRECVVEMIEQITKSCGECEFTEFLKNLEVERYL